MTDSVREVLVAALREDLKDQDAVSDNTICIVHDVDSLGASIANITGDVSLNELAAACLRALKAAGLTITDAARLAELEAAAVWNTDMDAAPKDKPFEVLHQFYEEEKPEIVQAVKWDRSPEGSVVYSPYCKRGMSRPVMHIYPIAWKPITPHEGG